MGEGRVDLTIVGAGVCGVYLAVRLQRERPDWSIAVFERTNRIGGRLRSVKVHGLDHPIELGGMRFMSTHRRVASIVDDFGVATHPFDRTGGHERAFLRGVVAQGPGDPIGGANYDLEARERGRSALELWRDAFDRIIPDGPNLDHEAFVRLRASAVYRGRRLCDWSIGEALETILSLEGRRYVRDAFGYDSGIRAFNAPDFIEFLQTGGDPTAEALTPDEGMDVIPRSLAKRFEAAGGVMRLGHEVTSLAIDGGSVTLGFADGRSVESARVVLTAPVRALQQLAASAPALQQATFQGALSAVEGFPAMKLYLWYDRPWWRPLVSATRCVTDLPVRKVFYVDDRQDGPAPLLAMYTDARDVDPWLELAGSVSDGSPAPHALLEEVHRCLREMHPEIDDVPRPIGSASCTGATTRMRSAGISGVAEPHRTTCWRSRPSRTRRSPSTSPARRSPDTSPGSKARSSPQTRWSNAC